jgi:hypothetical protein
MFLRTNPQIDATKWPIKNSCSLGRHSLLHVDPTELVATDQWKFVDALTTLGTKMPLVFVQSMAIFVQDCNLGSQCI